MAPNCMLDWSLPPGWLLWEQTKAYCVWLGRESRLQIISIFQYAVYYCSLLQIQQVNGLTLDRYHLGLWMQWYCGKSPCASYFFLYSFSSSLWCTWATWKAFGLKIKSLRFNLFQGKYNIYQCIDYLFAVHNTRKSYFWSYNWYPLFNEFKICDLVKLYVNKMYPTYGFIFLSGLAVIAFSWVICIWHSTSTMTVL